MYKKAKSELKFKVFQHGERLIEYFHIPKGDSLSQQQTTLCKALFRIENQIHRACEEYCNGTIEEGKLEKLEKSAMKRIKNLLGTNGNIFINQDPRGYALKIKTPNDFYFKDWGGYGIIAPDLRVN